MTLKRFKWVGLLLALMVALLLPALRTSAADLGDAARGVLTQAAQLRSQKKSADAVKLLDEGVKQGRQDRVGTAAMQFVLADIYFNDPPVKDQNKAYGLYKSLAMAHMDSPVEIPGLGQVDIQHQALKTLDVRNQSYTLYKVMAGIAGAIGDNPVTGRLFSRHSGVLAILLLTVAIKLLLTPLTAKSFRSMREMQTVQPLMKELQQKYKDKPQELNKRMMELYKEHGVNPLAGCVPMLLQMPIIILLWRGIDFYQYPLSQESFLWIKSLAMGDMTLAVIYAASLWASSKLTMMPTADPAQEQQQRMMATMMPLMFFFMFKSYPAGFILGWLFFNVLTTAQQWHMLRGHSSSAPGPARSTDSGSGGSNGGGGSNRQKNLISGGGNGSTQRVSKPLPPSAQAIRRKKKPNNVRGGR